MPRLRLDGNHIITSALHSLIAFGKAKFITMSVSESYN